MKINMRSATAMRRAAELYRGDSLPLSVNKDGKEPLKFEWWQSFPQPERLNQERHKAALRLYAEIGEATIYSLPNGSFPAVMDFEDAAMRPDKGAIKALIDEGIVVHHFMGAQLVFDLTEPGQQFLKS